MRQDQDGVPGAMVICVIAVHGHPLWLELLIFATVLITVLAGADYFFGLRRGLAEQVDGQRAASGGDQGT